VAGHSLSGLTPRGEGRGDGAICIAARMLLLLLLCR